MLSVVLLFGLSVACFGQTQYHVKLFGGEDPAAGYGQAGDGRYVGGTTSLAYSHRVNARLWEVNTGRVTDLNPPGYEQADIQAMAPGVQGGWCRLVDYSPFHACLWRGTPESVVDLHPPGVQESYVLGVDDGLQVGFVEDAGGDGGAGVVWRGTATSAVFMTPSGYYRSGCAAVSQGQIVGETSSYIMADGATLWRSAHPEDYVILKTPASYRYSYATDIKGDFIVGSAVTVADPFSYFATVWWGASHIFYNLHDARYVYTSIAATNGRQHAGYSFAYNEEGSAILHAMVWTGLENHAIDLHDFLPPGVFKSSQAYDILDNGSIVGTAYGRNYTDRTVAVVWTPLERKP
jgi:hypothetical protein